MVVVDANVLLYAINRSTPHHDEAHSWLEEALSGGEAVGFAWVVLLAVARISTNPAILPTPLRPEEAFGQIEAWLSAPAAVEVHPGPRHLDLLRELVSSRGTAGNLTTDAHLAALAIEHRAELVSYDRDFGAFPGLRHRLPGIA